MTKIQLAAKAIWNGLLAMAFGRILISFPPFFYAKKLSYKYAIPAFLGLCVLLFLIFRLWKNFKLPLRLSGVTAIKVESDSRCFFIQTQRLCYIFVGLLFMSGSVDAIRSIIYSLMRLFPSIQLWITLWVRGEVSMALERAFGALAWGFYPLGYLLFAVYLVCGANQLVRWQMNLLDNYKESYCE